MAKQAPNSNNNITARVFMYLSLVGVVILLIIGGAALWAHNLIGTMVKSELAAQHIYFPEKGSPALNPEIYPDLQQYAGELVDTPEEAKAYANGYIGRHLKDLAGGKSYSEISEESRLNPSNQELQQQKQVLLQGETLRSMLLTSGYGFGTMGQVAGVLAWSAFAASGVLLLLTLLFRIRS